MNSSGHEFEASYWRAMSTLRVGKDFVDSFYERFFAASDEVAPFFHGKDLEQLKRKLRLSLLFMTSFQATEAPSPALQRIAEQHGPDGEDIPPHLFEVWQNSLIETVRDYDSECTHETMRRWQAALEPGVHYMKSHCRAR